MDMLRVGFEWTELPGPVCHKPRKKLNVSLRIQEPEDDSTIAEVASAVSHRNRQRRK
jgi:hypothetical protein